MGRPGRRAARSAGVLVEPTLLATRIRRHRRVETDPGVEQLADVMVSAGGRLDIPHVYAVISRVIDPHAATPWRHHDSTEIVCVVISGTLACERRGEAPAVLCAEDIAILSTNRGLDYRWRALGDEPARAVFFWLPGRVQHAPSLVGYRAARVERLRDFVPLAGRGAQLSTASPIKLSSVVLSAGATIQHDARHRHSYIVPTLGPITVDGLTALPGTGVFGAGGVRRICALQSTEVLVIES